MRSAHRSSPRRGRRAFARRGSIGLSLVLLAGAVAVPAFADTHAAITSPTDGEQVSHDPLRLTAFDRDTGFEKDDVTWAVRTFVENTDCLSRTDVAGNVRGNDDAYEWTNVDGHGEFSASVSALSPGDYCFAINTSDTQRLVHRFSIVDPFTDFGDDEVTPCYTDGEDVCSISAEGEQSFTVSTTTPAKPDRQALIGLRIPDPADPVAATVSAACDGILDPDQRLGSEVAHLVAVGFEDGVLNASTLIPRDQVNSDVSRGNDMFEVCVAPAHADADAYRAEYGELEPLGEDTGLVGPILLNDCTDGSQVACVESRQRIRGADLVLTYRLPTVDPYFR